MSHEHSTWGVLPEPRKNIQRFWLEWSFLRLGFGFSGFGEGYSWKWKHSECVVLSFQVANWPFFSHAFLTNYLQKQCSDTLEAAAAAAFDGLDVNLLSPESMKAKRKSQFRNCFIFCDFPSKSCRVHGSKSGQILNLCSLHLPAFSWFWIHFISFGVPLHSRNRLFRICLSRRATRFAFQAAYPLTRTAWIHSLERRATWSEGSIYIRGQGSHFCRALFNWQTRIGQIENTWDVICLQRTRTRS